ncbi:uncharacterized protein LOC144652312 isoform X3 [Oculina patagonica]
MTPSVVLLQFLPPKPHTTCKFWFHSSYFSLYFRMCCKIRFLFCSVFYHRRIKLTASIGDVCWSSIATKALSFYDNALKIFCELSQTRTPAKVIKESGVKFFYTWTLKVSLHMRCQPVQQNLNLAHLLYLRSTHPGPISIKRFYAHRLTLTKTGLIQCTQMFFANEVGLLKD